MPRTQINQASVFQACDEFYIMTGKDPGYDEVHLSLGGSFSTIKPYLKEWLKKDRPPRFPLPEAIGTRATHLAQVIWSFALADARQTFESQSNKADEALGMSKRELETAMEEIRRLENEGARLVAVNEALIQERAELKVRLESLECLRAQLEASQAATESMRDARDQARSEASLAQGQIQALEKQITQLLQPAPERPVKARRPRNGHQPMAKQSTDKRAEL